MFLTASPREVGTMGVLYFYWQGKKVAWIVCIDYRYQIQWFWQLFRLFVAHIFAGLSIGRVKGQFQIFIISFGFRKFGC